MLYYLAVELYILIVCSICHADENAEVACKQAVSTAFCRDGMCLPRIFILGAAKSSTTSLWSLMRWQMGNICSPVALDGDPKWFRKEGTFFNVDEYFDDEALVNTDNFQRC